MGIASQALAELGYAAQISGTDLENVEGAVRKMQKAIGAAEQGNKEAADSFARLGISLAELQRLSPEDQLQLVADKIAAISDPTMQAAAAMQIFGKTGTSMLPMLANMRQLKAEAKELGIAPSQQDVAQAARLKDVFYRLSAVTKNLWFNIGAALRPPRSGSATPRRGSSKLFATGSIAIASWWSPFPSWPPA